VLLNPLPEGRESEKGKGKKGKRVQKVQLVGLSSKLGAE